MGTSLPTRPPLETQRRKGRSFFFLILLWGTCLALKETSVGNIHCYLNKRTNYHDGCCCRLRIVHHQACWTLNKRTSMTFKTLKKTIVKSLNWNIKHTQLITMDTSACQARKNVAKCDNSFEMRTTWLFEILNANCTPRFVGESVCLSAKYK